MTRDEFEQAVRQIFESPFDEKLYLKHLFLDDEDGIAHCRVILKKIKQKIEDKLAEWDAAEDKSEVENTLQGDPSLYTASEKEIAHEKLLMAGDGIL